MLLSFSTILLKKDPCDKGRIYRFFTNLSTEIVYKCGLGLIGLFIKSASGESYPEYAALVGKRRDKLECLFTRCTDYEKITINRDLY
ncbi:hypothetical protein GCM10007086_26200 [Photobacterium aphoticum]|nr:hypothetical protein GCM10007086_26200 [Photobacterium aphoticum]